MTDSFFGGKNHRSSRNQFKRKHFAFGSNIIPILALTTPAFSIKHFSFQLQDILPLGWWGGGTTNEMSGPVPTGMCGVCVVCVPLSIECIQYTHVEV
jgi:hypothetical protein